MTRRRSFGFAFRVYGFRARAFVAPRNDGRGLTNAAPPIRWGAGTPFPIFHPSKEEAQFWLTGIGLAGVIVGSIMQTLNGSVAVLAAGSALMIAGAVILAWLFWERATA